MFDQNGNFLSSKSTVRCRQLQGKGLAYGLRPRRGLPRLLFLVQNCSRAVSLRPTLPPHTLCAGPTPSFYSLKISIPGFALVCLGEIAALPPTRENELADWSPQILGMESSSDLLGNTHKHTLRLQYATQHMHDRTD